MVVNVVSKYRFSKYVKISFEEMYRCALFQMFKRMFIIKRMIVSFIS